MLNQHVEMTYNHCLSALEYSFQQFLEMFPYLHACKLISVFFSCSYISVLKGNNTLPPEDRLLKFLVDTNADAEETVQCANCDQESNKKVET